MWVIIELGTWDTKTKTGDTQEPDSQLKPGKIEQFWKEANEWGRGE